MNGNAGGLVYDYSILCIGEDGAGPVNRVNRKSFRLDMDADIVPGKDGCIDERSPAIDVDPSESRKPQGLVLPQLYAVRQKVDELIAARHDKVTDALGHQLG